MNVMITARHCEVPAPVQERAERLMRRMERFDPRVQVIEVIFEADAGAFQAEARVSIAGGPTVIAQGTDRTVRGALDRMVDRLQRQLRKGRDRERNHQADRIDPQVTAVA